MMRSIRLIAAALLASIVSMPVFAAACATAASGNWSTAGTWAAPCNVAGGPVAGDTVTIGAAHTVTVTANAAATSISVTAPSGATNGVSLSAGVTLNVSGAISMAAPAGNNRTLTFAVGSGTLTAGSIAISGGTGGTRISQMTVSTGTVTVTGAVTSGGTAAQSRFISTGASSVTIGGNFSPGAFTPGASTVTVSGNFAPTTMAAGGSGTVIFTGGAAQTVGAYTTYNNLTINKTAGTTATLAGTTTIGGALTVTSGTLSSGTLTLTVNGAATVNGTFSVAGTTLLLNGTTSVGGILNITSTTGTKTFVGAVSINAGGIWNNSGNEAITLRGGLTHNGATFTAGTGVYTFDTNAQAIGGASAISIPRLTVTSPTVLTNSGTLTVGTALSGNGNLTNTATLNIGGTSAITGLTANAAGNTVNYSGGTQTIKTPTGAAPLAYHHLRLTGSGAKTAAAGLIVNGDLTLSGTARLAAGALTHNFYGNWIVNTSAAAPLSVSGASSINFNAPTPAAATSISGTTTATLAFSDVNINNPSGVNFNENASFSAGTTPTLSIAAGATLTPAPTVILSGTGTLTGSGTAQVTRTAATAGFSQQYTIATKTLTNLTVEYVGTAAQTVSALTYGGLKINNASATTLAAGTTTVGGTLTLTSGTLTVGANTLVLNGPAIAGTTTNLSTTSSSALSFGGSSTGVSVPGSVTALNNLTVNNTNGVSLNGNVTVSTLLTLTSGAVSTGAFQLTTAASCPASISRTGGYVIGKLTLTFPLGTTTCTYHVGSGTTYAPIGITMVATTGGTLTGSTTGSEHPQIASSLIDSTRDANRYWTLWASGDTLSASSYSPTFNFVTGDLDALATPANFVVGKYAASAWTLLTPVTAGATSTGVSIAAGITALTDFVAGEAYMSTSTAAKSFAPSTITEGAASVLTIALTNPTVSVVTGVSFTDTYPAGMVNTAAANAATTCGGTVTAANNGNSVALSGGTIPASGSCTVSVNVTSATAGSYLNSTGTMATNSGAIPAASATLTVNIPEFGRFNACDVAPVPNAACTNTTTVTTSHITTKIASTSFVAGASFSLDLVALKNNGSRNTGYSNPVLVELLDSSNNGGTLDPNNCRSTWTLIATLSPNPAFAPANLGLITVGPFSVPEVYRDVRVRVTNVGGPVRIGCSTDNFAIRPNTLVVSPTDNTWETPGTARPLTSTNVSGGVVHKAGQPFTVTATAQNASNVTTVNYAGSPTSVLSACGGTGCPAAANLGSFVLGATSFVSGVLTSNAATYSEVGAFNLTLQDTDFALVDATDTPATCAGSYVCGTTPVGRFVPDHFAVTPGSVGPGCGTFTYFGQDGFTTVFTLTAQNAGNATTANYVGDGSTGLAKLPLTLWGGFGFAVSTWVPSQPAGANIAASGTAPTATNTNTWVSGSTTVTAKHQITRPTSPAAPTTVTVSALPVDSDGVTTTAATSLGSSEQRYGILKLDNAYGSELLNIRVPVRALYLQTAPAQFAINALDNCTTITPANIAIGNQSPAAFATNFTMASNQPLLPTTLVAGTGTLILRKPAPSAVSGKADIALNLGLTGTLLDVSCNTTHPATTAANMPWLQGRWGGSIACPSVLYDRDPNARITFGIAKSPFIYLREKY